MRAIIIFLLITMFILVMNIIAYATSEDYRFFLKKMKYPDDVVYTQKGGISDSSEFEIIDTTPQKIYDNNLVEPSKESITFLEALSGKKVIAQEDELPEMTAEEEEFINLFNAYGLIRLENPSTLFDVTAEYPDPYYDYYSPEMSIYVFPTKTYGEVKNILEVISYELPFDINAVNNFAEASFYINFDETFDDGFVRIVLEYKNRAFGLKIKKDLYNSVKPLLENL